MNSIRWVVVALVVSMFSACNCNPSPTEDAGTGGGGGETGGGSATGGGGSATGGGGSATGGGGGSATGGGGGSATGGGGQDVDAGMPELELTPADGMISAIEGETASFMVRLTAQPSASVTVTLASSDTNLATLSVNSLTFTTTDWNVAQPVTVTSLADLNLVNDSVDVTLTAAGLTARTVHVAITDVDTQAFVITPTGPVTVNENGTTTIAVRLARQPSGSVTATIASANPQLLGVSSSSVTFDPTNYATPVDLTVSGLDDANAADDDVQLSMTMTGAQTLQLVVTVADDDQQAFDFNGVGALQVQEDGMGALQVRLAAQPVGNVTVSFSTSDTGVFTVLTPTLSFSTTNWNTYQSMAFAGVHDDDLVNNLGNLTVSATGLMPRVLSVENVDVDMQALVLPASVTVNEFDSASLGVHLAKRPASPVTVTLTPSDPTRILLVPSTLTFDPANALINQFVAVNGLPDDDVADDTIPISVTVSGGGPTGSVDAIELDDDTQAIQTATTFSVIENATNMLPVRLAFRPATNVTVTLVSADANVATVSPSTLTFTPAGYATNQFVTVSGTNDPNLIDNSTTITSSAPGIASFATTINVSDEDLQAIQASTTILNVNENGSANLGVRLAFQPATSVSVSLATAFTDISLGSSSLLFTPGNYDTVQNVTVNGLLDLDGLAEGGTITLSSSMLPNVNVSANIVERTTRFGFISANAANFALTDGVVYAYPLTLTAGEAPFGYGANAGVASGSLQIALYADAAGAPGNLVAGTTSAFAVTTVGANDAQVAVGSTLAAGTYWLAFRSGGSVTLRSGGPAIARCVRNTAVAVGSPWPSTFGAMLCSSAAPTNVYVFTVH